MPTFLRFERSITKPVTSNGNRFTFWDGLMRRSKRARAYPEVGKNISCLIDRKFKKECYVTL